MLFVLVCTASGRFYSLLLIVVENPRFVLRPSRVRFIQFELMVFASIAGKCELCSSYILVHAVILSR
jgi:hypothetical protein